MGFRKLIILFFGLYLAACATQKPTAVKEKEYFKKFALAMCFGKSFKHNKLQKDVGRSLNGYREYGRMDLEAYEELRHLVDLWRNKDYSTKDGEQIHIPKCLDLYESKDLDILYQKHTPCKDPDSWLNKASYIKNCK